jgi:thiamine pyrophosphate-dependent acetolactate synthase large subunit-like protein
MRDCLKERDIVVAALAGTTYDCYKNLDRSGNLYAAGMGMATPVGFGLALALPKRRVIVLDTDGSLLLSPSILAIVGAYKPKNLSVLVFDNERLYGSRGGPPSQTAFGADLAGIAIAAGIEKAATVETLDAFKSKLPWFLLEGGPAVLIAKVKPEFHKGDGPRMSGQENKFKLVRFIEETEKIEILGAAK